MSLSRRFLAMLSAFERAACVLGFILMGGALILDVGARLWSRAIAEASKAGVVSSELAHQFSAGGGVLGAPQIAVIGMIMVAMFGLGVAIDKGAQLRARFLDALFPKSWSHGVDRIADLITALAFGAIAALSAVMTQESFVMGDVTSVLRWPIWPLQTIIVVAFLLNAVRHLIFCFEPDTRPREDLEPETSAIEEAPR